VRGGVVKSIQSRRTVLLTTLLIMSAALNAVGIPEVFAQASPAMEQYHSESKQTVARKITAAMSKRSVNQAGGYGTDTALGRILDLPPLPGEQAFTDSAKIEDSRKYIDEGKIPDFGKDNRSSVNMVLPPLKGFQQLTDSEALKEMFNGLVTAKVPVLFQTYMMVENGAATGYIGSLNAVSNVMANTMQTQDYQLKLLELTDDTGKMREAYIKRLKDAFKESKEVWPAALYASVGDSANFENNKGMTKEQIGEKGAYDLRWLPTENGSEGEKSKRKLSDLLFLAKEDQNAGNLGGPANSSTPYDNTDLNNLKQEFVRLIGDVEIELKTEEGSDPSKAWLRTLNMNFIAPEKEEERRGVARENWSEVQVTWEGINMILYNYCQFVKDNPNSSRKIESGQFKMTAATSDQINNPGDGNPAARPWEYISSPDIPVTMSLIEALFHLVRHTDEAKGLDCDKLNLTRDDIPTERHNGSGGGGSANLNDCGKNKGCLRNRLILHMSYIIARSRTLHTYRTMYLLSKRFATDPALDELVDELFMRSLSGMNIDNELGRNREAWERFTSFLTKIVQGDSYAGAFFRPGQFAGGRGGAPENGGSR
jgi:hypothetical protein